MIVFRAMCEAEAAQISQTTPLSWKSRYKWFGTEEFVKTRVLDGMFNNSKYAAKYTVVCQYKIIHGIHHFSVCGNRELMLDRRKANQVKIELVKISRVLES